MSLELNGPSIDVLVEEAMVRWPDRLAVQTSDGALTYGALNELAGGVAAALRRLGVEVGDLVAVTLPRGPRAIAAVLGVMRVGAAYLPIERSWPLRRRRFALEDSTPTALILRAGDDLIGMGVPSLEIETIEPCLSPFEGGVSRRDDELAYVLYTSGSSGLPKPVAIEHRSVVNLIRWHVRTFSIRTGCRMSQLAPLGYDAAVWEIWPTLATGASLHIVPEAVRALPASIARWIETEAITHAFIPTPVAEGMLRSGSPAPRSLRVLFTGGDRLRCYPPPGFGARVINAYGPTEATVLVTAAELEASDVTSGRLPPIGRPIDGVKVQAVDERLQPVASGEVGELCISGVALARGYINRPRENEDRFVESEVGRIYRTGDLGRLLEDGTFEFCGRSDSQIKIRGHRVEPAEVEAPLRAHPDVEDCAVVTLPGGHGLAAFVATHRRDLDVTLLRRAAAAELPGHMVPRVIRVVRSIAITPNGKVDRETLRRALLSAEPR